MHTLRDFDNLEFSHLHRKITFCAGGGSFIDAYVLIIIGVALENLVKDFSLDAFWVGVISASTFVGLAIGTFLFGYIGDKVGRKAIFIFNILALATCSVLSACVQTPLELAIARFAMGLLIGGDYPIATSMVAEFAPIKSRAWAMGLIAAIWYVGGIAASLVGFVFYDWDNAWRWMLASAVIPCFIVFWGRLSVPESPRWLIEKQQLQKAKQALVPFGLDVPLSELEKQAPKQLRNPSIRAIFQGKNLHNLMFVSIIWVCQVVPMFAIYMFGPQIMAGFDEISSRDALLCNTIIGFAFFLGCFPAMWSIQVFGRRKMCILCFGLMALSLGAMLLFEHYALVLLACFLVYALASGGPGTLQWLYPNELFSTDIRASAVGCAMSITRVVTIVSTFYLYPLLLAYGSSAILTGAVVLTVIGLITSIVLAPETKGVSLSESSS